MSAASLQVTPDSSVLVTLESADHRRSRRALGVLLLILGAGLAALLFSVSGTARFALSDAFDEVQLPVIELPGFPTVLICALLVLASGALTLSGRLRGWQVPTVNTVAGLSVVLGFITWAAADRAIPFPVSNQLAGTLAVATPLVFGALAGVLCERSGVVNVSIEGQFLTAAFAAAVSASLTKSILVGLVVGILAAVAMAALLALFAIKYLVDQVVLGVVLNLLAAGLTGFLFDQLVQPNALTMNSAPILQKIPIPVLEGLPFIGPIFFNQTILAYLAVVSVALVWFLLYRTKWGLRVRAVGEHPRAADTVGVSVIGIRWSAVLLGGVFAGLGGAFFTIGATGAFVKDMTVGNGFIALAALIMGRWHPILAAVMAVFFGFVTQLGLQVQALSTPVPSNFLLLLPYVATIIAVAGVLGKSRAPAADGKPYVK
jgi:simple sugar transport system permease protein